MIGVAIANSLGLSSASAALDPSAAAYFAATGITGATQQAAIDNLVKGLKTDGIWSKMKAVYPFATDNKNFIGYTEDFSNAYWFKSAVTITTNSVTAPNGTLTADSLVENTANTDHYISTSPSLTLSVAPYTFSMYFKKATRDWANISLYDGTDSKVAYFNVNTGTIGTVQSGATASIENAGNGWYRCSITRTMSSGINYAGIGASIIDGGGAYLGNGSTALYIWGAQVELGSTATTYQPIATTQQAYIANQFKYNLVNPVDSDAAFRLVFNGGWTHSSNGATPNGTNGYADSKILGGTDLTTNNSGIGIYSGTQSLKNGGFGTGLAFHIYPRFTDSNTYYRIMNIGGGFINNLSSLGFIHGYSNASNGYGFYNSNKVRTMNKSAEIDTANLFFGGQRPSIAEYDNKQLRFAFASQYLTDTEAANLYTRVQAFQTSLSRQV